MSTATPTAGIKLTKGQRVSLVKEDGGKLTSVCIGLNWGAIEKKGLFGIGGGKEAVDLDASVGCFDGDNRLVETVYFGTQKNSRGEISSRNGAILHSGDDREGDLDGDDGLDNEIITVDLTNVDESVKTLAFVLNSYEGHDFKDIPFATLRIYEGTPDRVDNVLATYDIANDAKFAGSVSMIMGKLYRHNGEFKFAAIGVPDSTKRLAETLNTVQRNYL